MGNISLFIGGVQSGFLPASILTEIDPRAMTDAQLTQVITETQDINRIKSHVHEYSQRNDLPLDWFAASRAARSASFSLGNDSFCSITVFVSRSVILITFEGARTRTIAPSLMDLSDSKSMRFLSIQVFL